MQSRALGRTLQSLRAVLRERGRDEALAARVGLGPDAARALVLVEERPGRAPALGFHGDCTKLPRFLLAEDRARVPVASTRVPALARAHRAVSCRNATHGFLEGCLGALLRSAREPSTLLALSAGHVFGGADDACAGDAVELHFDDDEPPLPGTLLDWQPNFLRLPGETEIDAAIARVDAGAAEVLRGHPGLWPLATSIAFEGDELRLLSPAGELPGRDVRRVSAWLTLDEDPSRAYLVQDGIGWRTDSPTQGGDSGAPVWNRSDEIVGIHAGGQYGEDEHSALAVPIGRILRWAGADLVRRGQVLDRRPAPRVLARPPVPAEAASPPGSGDLVVLARTVWGEARGEGRAGMLAVAHVVLNRVAARSWWGRDVAGVCRKPWQFSCWNANDPNLPKLTRVDSSDPAFRTALDVAAAVLAAEGSGTRPAEDPTAGATHYHARGLSPLPRWAAGRAPCARVGRHEFYKGIA